MPQETRPDEKEIQRLMGIAHGQARLALAKPETQRQSYLASCRLNWKRYAAGFTGSEAERERFAAALDGATRDMMAVLLESGTGSEGDDRDNATSVSATSVLGDEAITAYEAGYVLPALDMPMKPDGVIPDAETAGAEPEPAAAARAEPETEDDGRIRYGRPVFTAGGAPPLGTTPASAAEIDPALDEIRQRTRRILGRRNRRGI
jgi:hypothetical protein